MKAPSAPDASMRDPRRGSAFIVVMMLTGILMIAGAALTYMTSNAAFTSRKINNGVRALAIAEAGIADMLTRIETNYNYWVNNRSNSATFAEGSYSVRTERKPNGNILITSTGLVGDDKRITILELLGSFSFDGVIVAGGNLTLRNPCEIHGDVHANGSIFGGSSPGDVFGDMSAGGTIAFDPNGAGFAKTESAPAIPVSDVADAQTNPIPMLPISGWLALATNGGMYYPTNKTFSGVDLRPSNGVVFVQGDITIGQRSSVSGVLVAAGSIYINNYFEHFQFAPGWPAFIAGWNIEEDNRNTYAGAMYCGNNYESHNNRSMTGMIIAENNVLIENRGVIYPATNSAGVPSEIRFGGWLR